MCTIHRNPSMNTNERMLKSVQTPNFRMNKTHASTNHSVHSTIDILRPHLCKRVFKLKNLNMVLLCSLLSVDFESTHELSTLSSSWPTPFDSDIGA